MTRLPHLLLIFALLPSVAGAQGFWEQARDKAGKAYDKGSELAKPGVEKGRELGKKGAEKAQEFAQDTADHFDRKGTPEEIRQAIDKTADAGLQRMLKEHPGAKALAESSYGYAVFAVRQVSVTVVAGYGYGVAVENQSQARTYMKMAIGGAGFSLGLGGSSFELVILLEDEASFRQFVVKGFNGQAEAYTIKGEEHNDVINADYKDGMAVFRLTSDGYYVAATLTGSRFWSDDSLNAPAATP
jgi:lipid-binding SYLF domain-containing protein